MIRAPHPPLPPPPPHPLPTYTLQVLLFPGGAREVVKRKDEAYQLMWKETPDFVRLAAKCKALIVPFAAVGADDAYDVIMVGGVGWGGRSTRPSQRHHGGRCGVGREYKCTSPSRVDTADWPRAHSRGVIMVGQAGG